MVFPFGVSLKSVIMVLAVAVLVLLTSMHIRVTTLIPQGKFHPLLPHVLADGN